MKLLFIIGLVFTDSHGEKLGNELVTGADPSYVIWKGVTNFVFFYFASISQRLHKIEKIYP